LTNPGQPGYSAGMKQRICYKWETADPSLTFLDEALNRLQSFEKPDLDESYLHEIRKRNIAAAGKSQEPLHANEN